VKFVATNSHAADHICASVPNNGLELFESLPRFDCIRAEHGSALTSKKRQLRETTSARRFLTKEEQTIGPTAHNHKVSIGKGLVVNRCC